MVGMTLSGAAAGFTHIVRQGETVAAIAERMYGRVELERLVVHVNGLDGRRGATLVAGMRLEVPAVGHYKVLPGDSWQSIAEELLGTRKRGDALAQFNKAKPWLKPAAGRELTVPYNVRYVARRGDTTESVAYRFLGRRDRAWMIATYNGLRRAQLRQGEVIVVPVMRLQLTPEGRSAARLAGALVRGESGGQALAAQRRASGELPQLAAEVRRGRYVEALTRGAGLLAGEALSEPQLAAVYRLMTETYAALGARGLAATACANWREHEPTMVLDPIDVSPKIIEACVEPGGAPTVDQRGIRSVSPAAGTGQ